MRGKIMEPMSIEAAASAIKNAEQKTAQPKRKLPFNLIIVAVAASLVLGGGGAAAYFISTSKKEKAEEAKAAAPMVKPLAFLDLPDVLVNLSNPGGDRMQLLKVKIVLEVPDQALIQQIQPVMPRVMDAFQTYLRELRPTDLEGSAGLYRLKEELTRRVNVAIEPARINAVLLKELIIQ
jgi:flagellar FliL protein